MTASEANDIFTAITEDGSMSLVSGEHKELYHNKAGAYSEALYNYSNVAFAAWRTIHNQSLPQSLNVLDCCFGLGYNSFVLAQELPPAINLDVTAIELDFNVLRLIPQVLAQSCFYNLRQVGVGPEQALELSQFKKSCIATPVKNSRLMFEIIQSDLRAYLRDAIVSPEQLYDLVLHDPFSPKKMPELWTIDLFASYKMRLKECGFVLTYSSAPAVRGALLDLGFYVYRTPSLGGKWGGTMAVVGDQLELPLRQGRLGEEILPLAEPELKRLAKSSRVPYRDNYLESSRDRILADRLSEQEAFNLTP